MNSDLKNFIVLDEIDSTNNYANHLIEAGTAENGTVVLASYQKKGRGQRNNYWESACGENLLASFILFPALLEASDQFYLSKVASLALVRWLSTKTTGVSIKWPNDIYVGQKKIAGILIETSVKGNTLYSAVVGIGLNLNQTQFSSNIPNPVSLKTVTHMEYNALQVARELLAVFMNLYHELESGSFLKTDNAYFNHLFRRNEWAWYREKGELIEGRISGIGPYGQLLLEVRSGAVHSYLFKEIEFIV